MKKNKNSKGTNKKQQVSRKKNPYSISMYINKENLINDPDRNWFSVYAIKNKEKYINAFYKYENIDKNDI